MESIFLRSLLIGIFLLSYRYSSDETGNFIKELFLGRIMDPRKLEKRNSESHRKQIPILCYHRIESPGKSISPDYIISPSLFTDQMRMLKDSGFEAILPDQLEHYLTHKINPPPKTVMITFDDSRVEHFTIAAPLLEQLGYRGVFFIMTVTIGKKGYMTADQIRSLSNKGHVIGCHSYDHPDLRKINEDSWDRQTLHSKEKLEEITGKPVKDFAYPNGAWNKEVIKEIKKRGYLRSYQLSGKRSEDEPLYTIRRMMVSGRWSSVRLSRNIENMF